MNTSAHYIEIVMLDDADEEQQARRIGRALLTPCLSANESHDDAQRLRFWATLIAFMLGAAEGSVGADGRSAIVQTMRNVGASTHRCGSALQ